MGIFAPPPLGTVAQVVNTLSTAVATGSTLIPQDDTIPQNTEGDQYMTLAITPKSATNTLVIMSMAFLSSSTVAGTWLTSALFQDTTANALAVGAQWQTTATGGSMVPVAHTMAAGTTSATTFKIRCGSHSAGTMTFNGSAAGRLYGAITKSYMVIWEYIS